MTTMWGSDEVAIRELMRDVNDSALLTMLADGTIGGPS